MLIALGRNERDAPLLVLGLEEGNLERLRKGQPIPRDLAEFGLPDLGSVLIVWGQTKADIESQLSGSFHEGTRRIEEGKLS